MNTPLETPEVFIMASGTNDGGGSGFKKIVEFSDSKENPFPYRVAGVICNIENGGVQTITRRLGIPFHHFPGELIEGKRTWTSGACYDLIGGRKNIMMSGWLKIITGLQSNHTLNIHPGSIVSKDKDGNLLCAGWGMHGDHVHTAALKAYRDGLITHSEVTIHAVTSEPDAGVPVARFPVPIYKNDTVRSMQKRVNKMEHQWQPLVLAHWLHGNIKVSVCGKSVIRSPFPH